MTRSTSLPRRCRRAPAVAVDAVGRTALTNYLSQSLICVALFRITHLYGVWGPAWDLLPTVILFAVQIVISNWWLQRFQFGPMEWLWRGMTYGSLPPLKRVGPK